MSDLRKLKIDMDFLKSSFEDASGRIDYYLDTETGDIEMDTEDDKFARCGDEDEYLYEDSRYLRVPNGDSHEGYKDMEAFIETIGDSRIQSVLEVAIQGSGAFSRFKSALYRYPKEQKRWFDFKDRRINWRVLAWLKSHGIKPLHVAQDEESDIEEDVEPDQDIEESPQSDLVELTPQDVTPALIALQDRTLPSAFRAVAVLEGECKGRIWTNDSAKPTWLIVQEGVFGTLFWSGAVTAEILRPLIARISQESAVKILAIALSIRV
jgi:hypothetical protein